MLSTDLEGMAQKFKGWADTGVELKSISCLTFAAALHELAEQARQLEDQPVPPGVRVRPTGDNVVLLWDEPRLRRRGGRVVPNPIDGGAA